LPKKANAKFPKWSPSMERGQFSQKGHPESSQSVATCSVDYKSVACSIS